jgi:hypothetical protein
MVVQVVQFQELTPQTHLQIAAVAVVAVVGKLT